jgi:hypothetical protein
MFCVLLDAENWLKSFAPMSRRTIRTGSGKRRRVGSCTMVGAVIPHTASLKFASASR